MSSLNDRIRRPLAGLVAGILAVLLLASSVPAQVPGRCGRRG